MVIKINTASFLGINGFMINLEVDLLSGIPSYSVVGLPDISVKESKERVCSAIKNSGFDFPITKIVVNLAPASIKKEGTLFDLPIALSILAASNQLSKKNLEHYVIVGELSLSGAINPVKGILPIITKAKSRGFNKFIVPFLNRQEASLIKDVEIYPFNNLSKVVSFINGKIKINPSSNFVKLYKKQIHKNFSDVYGQKIAKRTLEIASAGKLNIALIGPQGSGKTMLAERFPSILPSLTYEESLEVTKIQSVCENFYSPKDIIKTPPFRHPHHTASKYSLIGGSSKLTPGEISLSHHGVLFLDEITEYDRDTLDALRQPIESKFVNISRVSGCVTYPSDFILICAFNPCKCGNHLNPNKKCTCTKYDKSKYLSKLSGPFLDRIDLFTYITPPKYSEMQNITLSESSSEIKSKVIKARKIQLKRSNKLNGDLSNSEIKKYCSLSDESNKILEKIYINNSISARSLNKIIKIARTIADLSSEVDIKPSHIIESLSYRSFIDNLNSNNY